MLSLFMLAFFLAPQSARQEHARPGAGSPGVEDLSAWVRKISDSGRCAREKESPDRKVAVPAAVLPGVAPVLSFRFYEGKQHHRFGNSELLIDDAGH